MSGPSQIHMDPESVDAELRRHLERNGLLHTDQVTCWKVGLSKLSGRGLIATRDIARDELVYTDAPVVIGPRCHPRYLPLCVGCHSSGLTLFPCELDCGLPICSNECQNGQKHRAECSYLQALQPTCGSDFSIELLQALVPVRAVLMPEHQKRLVHCVQCNEAAQHGREVDLLKSKVAIAPSVEDESFMRIVCRAMDTNSFETAVIGSDPSTTTSLRALYPVGALTNHHCVPNTRHLVDSDGRLLTYAAMDIPAGHEITMTYTELLWDTTMRRQFLGATKHFACRCSRCADPTEFGSMLGALCCAKDDCLGKLLPIDSLSFNSAWTCSSCGLIIRSKQISAIRSGILAAIEEVLYDNPRKILRFIKRELSILVPETNYFMMDMMFRIVSIFGRIEGLTWQELTDDELSTKIIYCYKLIKSLDTLGCGDCTKKGLILYELHCANTEKMRRLSAKKQEIVVDHNNEIGLSKNELILIDAMKILKNDIVTPQDYREIYVAKSLTCKT